MDDSWKRFKEGGAILVYVVVVVSLLCCALVDKRDRQTDRRVPPPPSSSHVDPATVISGFIAAGLPTRIELESNA